MDSNFIIVLFKNKTKKKIIKKFKTFKRANEYYNSLLKRSNAVVFEKQVENTNYCKYEIALLEKNGNDYPIFKTDELGRSIRVLLEDPIYKIQKIDRYRVEEKIFDIIENRKISVEDFINLYLLDKTTKLISSINNKIVVQIDDKINLFSTKNSDEAHRFIDVMNNYLVSIGKGGTIFVKDTDPSQRAYIYKTLSEKGFDKKMLYRTKTTHRLRSA